MIIMKNMANNSVDFTLTDIPYDEVQRDTNGLSNLKSLDNLGDADELNIPYSPPEIMIESSLAESDVPIL